MIDSDAARIRAMFTRIARRYDVMNALMTGGRHHTWRRLAAAAVVAAPPGPILDLATGTGDLALAVRAARPGSTVIAADFSEAMLHQAGAKLARRREPRVGLLAADALALPFRDRTFAAVTSAFLVRNLVDLARGFTEMRRVNAPRGVVLTLHIPRPRLRRRGPVLGLFFYHGRQ